MLRNSKGLFPHSTAHLGKSIYLHDKALHCYHIPGNQPHIKALVAHYVCQIRIQLMAISWVPPSDVRVEVVIHVHSGRLVAVTWAFKDDCFISRAIPRVVTPITIRNHRLLARCQLWEFPACADVKRMII